MKMEAIQTKLDAYQKETVATIRAERAAIQAETKAICERNKHGQVDYPSRKDDGPPRKEGDNFKIAQAR
jgi:hypothetical protein